MTLPLLALRCAGTALLAAAAWDAGRKALADAAFREESPEGVDRAIALHDRDVRFWMARSLAAERSGGDAITPLLRAAELSPLDDLIWQRLGLRQELAGRAADAERSLLRAAELSRKYDPRWTLANFYFRQNRRDEFWKWARAGLESGWPDPRPLFDLCSAFEPDLERVERQAIPANPRMRLYFTHYLADKNRLDLAAAHAGSLESAGPELDGLIADLVDRLAVGYQVGAADRLRRKLNRPDLMERRSFDWQGPAVRSSTGWRLELNGDQPETLDIVARVAAVEPGRKYRLRWRADTRLSSPGGPLRSSGLRWSVQAWTKDRTPVAASEELAVSAQGGGELQFTAPGEGVRLSLEYRRPAGAMRAEGSVEVTDPALEPATP